jgi:hypothetical protein
VLSRENMPNAIRSILMLPAIVMLAAAGGCWLYGHLARKLSPRWLQVASAGILLALVGEAYHSYFDVWAKSFDVTQVFNIAGANIADRINALPKTAPKHVIVVEPGAPIGLPPLGADRDVPDRELHQEGAGGGQHPLHHATGRRQAGRRSVLPAGGGHPAGRRILPASELASAACLLTPVGQAVPPARGRAKLAASRFAAPSAKAGGTTCPTRPSENVTVVPNWDIKSGLRWLERANRILSLEYRISLALKPPFRA